MRRAKQAELIVQVTLVSKFCLLKHLHLIFFLLSFINSKTAQRLFPHPGW